MTGLYRTSILKRRRDAFADVRKAQSSLASLKNHDSLYAQEHRALISVLQKVADIYEEAPADLKVAA